jgi:hypothetical protein
MRKISLYLSFLFSLNVAFAGLELGVYEGKTPQQESCLVAVEAVEFIGVKHPLNERVKVLVSFSEANFVLSHPQNIDLTLGTVRAVGSTLSGALANQFGSEAVILNLTHTSDATKINVVNYVRESSSPELDSLNQECRDLVKR